jgi:hypothetical protein
MNSRVFRIIGQVLAVVLVLIVLLMLAGTLQLGVTGILIGIALITWLKKRQFDRKNEYGMSVYNSYADKIGTGLLDLLVALLGLSAIVKGIIVIANRLQ